jgi:hypothetical protein
MDLTAPLLSNSNRLSSDDSGSDYGSGDDALSFHTAAASVESEQPPVAAAAAPLAQRQISQLNDISDKIRTLNEMRPGEMEHSEIITSLFGTFSRIALALNNRTLTEGEANELYQLISQINIGDASRVNRLTRRQIKIIADIFKESAEGTARDLDLLTTMLRRNGVQAVQQVVARLQSATLAIERIFDTEKAVSAMMRLCTTLTSLGFQPIKCNEFSHRLAAGGLLTTGQPIDMASVTRMSQQEINLDQLIEPDFTFIIDEINEDAKRQEHESEVWNARLRFHKGGRGNMQKKQSSRSKKYKPKNTRKSKYNKSKYNKSKYNKQITKTQKKY